MLSIVRIRIVKLAQNRDFFETCFVHAFLHPDDFDCNFLSLRVDITRPHYRCKHTFSEYCADVVAII